jgi:hypothetical protein
MKKSPEAGSSWTSIKPNSPIPANLQCGKAIAVAETTP